jgi:uncharacterized protein YbjT (DUF2867 family)
VVNLVAILHGSAAEFERVHVELPKKLAAPARRRRAAPRARQRAGRGDAARRRTTCAARPPAKRVLQAAGLALTVLRPSVIFGAEDRVPEPVRRLQALAPVMPLAGARARFQPVWVEDVGERRGALPRRPAASADRLRMRRPQVYTLGELVRLAGRWSGTSGRRSRCPKRSAALQAVG